MAAAAAAGATTSEVLEVLKKILPDHDGNFGAGPEMMMCTCRLKGGSYDPKLGYPAGISGFQLGRWRWCYFDGAVSRKYKKFQF
mmetsp:Transcript_13243/g.15584  ORF Transcript_13243/g.15584 Transcript_13243/m.15584 type:complete len:84 (-) Transcript_13243:178-429(-)